MRPTRRSRNRVLIPTRDRPTSSQNPEVARKSGGFQVRGVNRFYLDSPENAIVLWVVEKPQIRALNRNQPVVPMRPQACRRKRLTTISAMAPPFCSSRWRSRPTAVMAVPQCRVLELAQGDRTGLSAATSACGVR